MRSRRQDDYARAVDLVGEVDLAYPAGDLGTRAIRLRYGALCHEFPVLVRNAGLAQAVAFYQAKSAGSDDTAFGLVLGHVATILGVDGGVTGLQARIASSDVRTYHEDSARVWDAWVYFKRLAVSVLRVQPGDEGPDNVGQEDGHA